MQNFIKLAWIDLCKTGTYLIINTPSATQNLTEQLKKYPTNADMSDSLSVRIFGDYEGTSGIHAHQLYKLKLLLDAIYTKAQTEEIALKDYAFALRNMLLHSDYKSVIKYLEKPSTTPDNAAAYLEEITASGLATTLDPFTKTNYLLLYSFIKNLTQTNRIIAKVSQATNTADVDEELEHYLQFATQNQTFSAHLQQQLIQPSTDEEFDVNELTAYFMQFHPNEQALNVQEPILAVALLQYLDIYVSFENSVAFLAAPHYFKDPYDKFEKNFRTLGLHVHEILQQATFTPADLYRLMIKTKHSKPTKQKKQLVGHSLNTALAQYLTQTTARLNSLFQQEPNSKGIVQKVTPKPAQDASLKKELFDTKNALKQIEAEQAQLKKQLKEAEQLTQSLQQKLTAAQLKNEQLQQQLTQNEVKETLSSNAKQLVHEIAFLTQELTAELGLQKEDAAIQEAATTVVVTEETMLPATPNYVERVQHLKIAIIGGHDQYHNNIKREFKQDVFTLSPARLNSDVSKLLNFDVLVFITSYNNHTLYNRSYDYVKKNQGKERCLILNTQPNPKRLAQLIYEFVEDKGFE